MGALSGCGGSAALNLRAGQVLPGTRTRSSGPYGGLVKTLWHQGLPCKNWILRPFEARKTHFLVHAERSKWCMVNYGNGAKHLAITSLHFPRSAHLFLRAEVRIFPGSGPVTAPAVRACGSGLRETKSTPSEILLIMAPFQTAAGQTSPGQDVSWLFGTSTASRFPSSQTPAASGSISGLNEHLIHRTRDHLPMSVIPEAYLRCSSQVAVHPRFLVPLHSVRALPRVALLSDKPMPASPGLSYLNRQALVAKKSRQIS